MGTSFNFVTYFTLQIKYIENFGKIERLVLLYFLVYLNNSEYE